ncbi:MAG: helix-turn-helix transcriptional regulator [Actinobacteria bacterium]|nr:helix-turn-helix transcriptional regulator [Actinomycetota bacterium]
MNRKIFELHAQICQTFTSPKRLEIIYALCDGEKTVSELAPLLVIRQANLSQHLAVLRQKKVVVTRRKGVNIYYRIAHPKILQACDIMREVLLEQIAEDEKLVRLIKKEKKN